MGRGQGAGGQGKGQEAEAVGSKKWRCGRKGDWRVGVARVAVRWVTDAAVYERMAAIPTFARCHII